MRLIVSWEIPSFPMAHRNTRLKTLETIGHKRRVDDWNENELQIHSFFWFPVHTVLLGKNSTAHV